MTPLPGQASSQQAWPSHANRHLGIRFGDFVACHESREETDFVKICTLIHNLSYSSPVALIRGEIIFLK